MNSPIQDRRDFIRTTALGGLALHMPDLIWAGTERVAEGKRVGLIGLDTSHSTAFVKVLNSADVNPDYKGYRVVAAYPYGSRDIESSTKRIPAYIDEVKKRGVAIVDSIDELLKNVDVVLLETNDGRLHREQALQVLKAGKRLFIDKPMAASLADVLAIFDGSRTSQNSGVLRFVATLYNRNPKPSTKVRCWEPIRSARLFGKNAS